MTNVLFLGYNKEKTRLIELLSERGLSVSWFDQPVSDISMYDAVISFGYRFILTADVLATARRPVLNLHISYLPWNRGAHPLFWAAYDATPVGVSIHEIDSGIDTGPICFQREVRIDPDVETFSSGYRKLINEIEDLFEENLDEIICGSYTPVAQSGPGSFKRVRDLPGQFSWNELIEPAVKRLRCHQNKMETSRTWDGAEKT